MTQIDKEAVKRLCHHIHNACDCQFGITDIEGTLRALRAALNAAEAEKLELERALDSHHADVGHNIWRFWRDKANEMLAKKNAAEARERAADELANAVAYLETADAFGGTEACILDALNALKAYRRAKAIRGEGE
jgi:hypothetical protein